MEENKKVASNERVNFTTQVNEIMKKVCNTVQLYHIFGRAIRLNIKNSCRLSKQSYIRVNHFGTYLQLKQVLPSETEESVLQVCGGVEGSSQRLVCKTLRHSHPMMRSLLVYDHRRNIKSILML